MAKSKRKRKKTKTVTRKARRKRRKQSAAPKRVTKRRRVKTMARRKRHGKKSRGHRGDSKPSMQHIAMDGAGIVGGAVGGAILSNVLPLPDLRMKAAASVLLGIVLASTNIIKGNLGKMAALGMVAGGSLSLLRRVLPTVPMLAGEEEPYQLGFETELIEGLDDAEEIEGEYEEIEQAGEDTDEMEGAMEELTGVYELEGADTSWSVAE